MTTWDTTLHTWDQECLTFDGLSLCDEESEVSVAPVITGIFLRGQTLTCSTGTWLGAPPFTYRYQWYREGSPIVDQTSNTYFTVYADVGRDLFCIVEASNLTFTGSAESNTVTILGSRSSSSHRFKTKEHWPRRGPF